MKLARIKSQVLAKALDDNHRKDFGVLAMYLQFFRRAGEDFITDYQLDGEKLTTGLKLALQDYFFNERESERLWKLAETTIGKKLIDMKAVKIVEL